MKATLSEAANRHQDFVPTALPTACRPPNSPLRSAINTLRKPAFFREDSPKSRAISIALRSANAEVPAAQALPRFLGRCRPPTGLPSRWSARPPFTAARANLPLVFFTLEVGRRSAARSGVIFRSGRPVGDTTWMMQPIWWRGIITALRERAEAQGVDYSGTWSDDDRLPFRVSDVAIVLEYRRLCRLEQRVLGALGPPTRTMVLRRGKLEEE
jgi:hypothetical protein